MTDAGWKVRMRKAKAKLADLERSYYAQVAKIDPHYMRDVKEELDAGEYVQGMSLDPGVRPLVMVLIALGLETLGSCEGHYSASEDNMSDTFVTIRVPGDEFSQRRWTQIMIELLTSTELNDDRLDSLASVNISRNYGHEGPWYGISLFYAGGGKRWKRRKRKQIKVLAGWLAEQAPRWLNEMA